MIPKILKQARKYISIVINYSILSPSCEIRNIGKVPAPVPRCKILSYFYARFGTMNNPASSAD